MMDLGLCVRPRSPNRTGRILKTAACRKKGAQMSRRGTGTPIGTRSYEGALRRLKARNRQKRRNIMSVSINIENAVKKFGENTIIHHFDPACT